MGIAMAATKASKNMVRVTVPRAPAWKREKKKRGEEQKRSEEMEDRMEETISR